MENLDPNIQRFAQSAVAAKRLMQMESNGTLDKVKTEAERSGRFSYDVNGQVNMNITESTNRPIQTSNKISQSGMKLPKEILESMTTNPIGQTTPTSSILDELNLATNGELLNQPQQITEQQTVSPMPISSTIDYSMIRMICEETMRKYISSLKKSMLNESKNSDSNTLKAMKIGDKFSFVTNNGEIYEAKLEYKGNINKKATK